MYYRTTNGHLNLSILQQCNNAMRHAIAMPVPLESSKCWEIDE